MLAPVVLLAGAANPPCAAVARQPDQTRRARTAWIATAYGPPWGGIQGDGITATGINLTAGQPAYVIAVDPIGASRSAASSTSPQTRSAPTHAFYAGDTGGAIIGHHIDIYDWQGRAAQDAWGKRSVTVTPAPAPGAGNLLGEITPTAPRPADTTRQAPAARAAPSTLPLTPGQTATILPDGQATAPADAPAAVKLAIAAGNQLIDKPYLYGGGHGQPLTELAAAYDCSSQRPATSCTAPACSATSPKPRPARELRRSRAGPVDHRLRELARTRSSTSPASCMDTAWYAPVAADQPRQRTALAARVDHRRAIRRRPARRQRRIRPTPPAGALMRAATTPHSPPPCWLAADARRLRTEQPLRQPDPTTQPSTQRIDVGHGDR